MCSIFSKATQPFDFIKPNVIRNLAYKVKYIREIVRGLIEHLRMRFFKIIWRDCEQYGKNQYKKKEHNQQFSAHNIMMS